MVILNGNLVLPFVVLDTLQNLPLIDRILPMKPLSYRFVVTREGDFPALGLLRDWSDGNEAALQHLENLYPDWTRITIQKLNGSANQSGGQAGNFRGLQKSSYRNRGVRSLA